MRELLDRAALAPLQHKAAVLVGVLVCVFGGYFSLVYRDMQDDRRRLSSQATRLDGEKRDFERRKEEYLAFQKEVQVLAEAQKELLRVLPKSDDVEPFIQDVQAQVELAGLSTISSVREAAAPVEMYVKIPLRMSLVGTYHQINHFFKKVGELKRIVNIEDLSLTPNGEAAPSLTAPPLLKANFVATTFQFQEKGTGGASKRPAIMAGGAK